MAQGVKYVENDVDREMVRKLARIGTPHEQIGMVLEINVDTLKKYYKRILDTEKIVAIANLGDNCYQKALAGDQKREQFYLNTQGGWAAHQEIVQRNSLKFISDGSMSDDEFEAMYDTDTDESQEETE